MILDGYGMRDTCEHNAVCEAKTPIMDQLMSQCPFVRGNASGLAVGLPDGQMGNSEVGHLNMGAGLLHKGVAILSMLMFTGCPFGSFRISAVLCMFRVMLAQPRMDGGYTRFHRRCRNSRHRKNHCRRQ